MYSINKTIENTIVIKKSKFITKLFYINDKNDIDKLLNNIKKEYKDATHVCYAYIFNSIEKCSDDKEPSGTAGVPMLDVLKKKNLTNILAIVIRYFGGIKLGTGGLTRAYKKAITDTINQEDIVELLPGYLVEIEFCYENTKKIDSILTSKKIISKNYDKLIKYKFYIYEDEIDILTKLNKICINMFKGEKILIKKD